jgi:hypothetical protein
MAGVVPGKYRFALAFIPTVPHVVEKAGNGVMFHMFDYFCFLHILS